MSRRTLIAVLTVTSVAAIALAIVLGDRDAPSRQEQVRSRGAAVMPFSLEATTHTFESSPAGGVQRVVAHDGSDARNIRLIRAHLRKEAAAFRRGDFGDPAQIHGSEMPGLRQLSTGHARIDVTYRELEAGAALVYRTSDPALVRALGRWFSAQLADHGDDAERVPGSGGHETHARHEE